MKTLRLSFSLTLMHCWTFCTFGIQEQKSQEFASANPICFHATAGCGNAFSLIKNWCPPVTQSQEIPQYFLSSLTSVINTLGCTQKSTIFFAWWTVSTATAATHWAPPQAVCIYYHSQWVTAASPALRISRVSTITIVTASAECCSGHLPARTHSAANGDREGKVITTT